MEQVVLQGSSAEVWNAAGMWPGGASVASPTVYSRYRAQLGHELIVIYHISTSYKYLLSRGF